MFSQFDIFFCQRRNEIINLSVTQHLMTKLVLESRFFRIFSALPKAIFLGFVCSECLGLPVPMLA